MSSIDRKAVHISVRWDIQQVEVEEKIFSTFDFIKLHRLSSRLISHHPSRPQLSDIVSTQLHTGYRVEWATLK
jgi:hypothetical protein